MARTYAKLMGSIWLDDDWRTLPARHQRLYLLVFSQPEITNCGVVPYVPTRWARLAADTPTGEILDLAADLDRQRYLIVDEETAEVLVRTFVKHDKVAEQPKLVTAARRQFATIQSPRIRTVLALEYPDLFTLRPDEQAIPEPYAEGYGEPYGEGYAVGSPARAREEPPLPVPIPAPAASTPHPPTANGDKPADAAAPNIDPDLRAQLERLEWREWQIRRAATDPARAQAIADLALEQATSNGGDVDNPGGWAWKEFDTGRTPAGPPQSTLAPGAYGATRSAPPKKLPHECDHAYPDGTVCGSSFATPERLAEHIDDAHADHERGPIPPEVAALFTPKTIDPPPDPEPPAPPRPTPKQATQEEST